MGERTRALGSLVVKANQEGGNGELENQTLVIVASEISYRTFYESRTSLGSASSKSDISSISKEFILEVMKCIPSRNAAHISMPKQHSAQDQFLHMPLPQNCRLELTFHQMLSSSPY